MAAAVAGTAHAFHLKLSNHQAHLGEQFVKLYNTDALCDCTVSTPGGSIKAHRLVLSACSPYFLGLFSSMAQQQYPAIVLKDVSYADLKYIIDFCYRGEATIPTSNLSTVLDAARSLSITGLSEVKNGVSRSSQDVNQGALMAVTSKSPTGRKRKSRRASTRATSAQADAVDGGSGQDQSEGSDASESELPPEKQLRSTDIGADEANDPYDLDELDEEIEQSEPTSSSHNLRSTTTAGGKVSNATLKANLRQQRIEKMSQELGIISAGRKMWSDEETRTLVKVWDEESARVWASAGKKALQLQRIVELLQAEGIDRDISQVEGKIKALKRDFKLIKNEKAIGNTQARMVPYMDTLEQIFGRDNF